MLYKIIGDKEKYNQITNHNLEILVFKDEYQKIKINDIFEYIFDEESIKVRVESIFYLYPDYQKGEVEQNFLLKNSIVIEKLNELKNNKDALKYGIIVLKLTLKEVKQITKLNYEKVGYDLKDAIDISEQIFKEEIVIDESKKYKLVLIEDAINPYLLESDLLTNLLQLPKNLINKLLNYTLSIVILENDFYFLRENALKKNMLTGVESIKFLLEQMNFNNQEILNKLFIKEIWIPNFLIKRINNKLEIERIDDLLYFICNKKSRMEKILEKNPPQIIIFNEKRMYQMHIIEYFEYLKNNEYIK